MIDISILDCTLRDGGNVNNWNFGKKNIDFIIKSLSESNVDIIELGHFKNNINDSNKTLSEKIDFFNKLADKSCSESKSIFIVMTRPDLFDIKNIAERKQNDKVVGIRFAFYPYHKKELKEQVLIAKDKGYEIYLNPIGVSCYKMSEIKSIIDLLNKLEPKCISIVDSFGALNLDSLTEIQHVFHNSISNEITLGLHLHENLGIAYALACKFIENNNNYRNLIIDSSILGMGRVPGNLCSEMIMDKVNSLASRKYNLLPIYDAIDKVINPIKAKISWGYMPHYFLSGKANVNRHYAEFFYEKNGISLAELPILFEKVKKFDSSGMLFSKEICEKILSERSIK